MLAREDLFMQNNGNERTFNIGRGRDCDIVLNDSVNSVSRLHAELTYMEDGRLFLVDCQSTNGTALFQNDRWEPIRQELVSPSDTIKFGSLKKIVRDLLEEIQLKFLVTYVPGQGMNAGPMNDFWKPKSGQLIRCGCGAVKNMNDPCPVCGH